MRISEKVALKKKDGKTDMVKGPSNFKNENLVLLHQIGPNLLSIGLESHKVFLHIMKLGYTS